MSNAEVEKQRIEKVAKLIAEDLNVIRDYVGDKYAVNLILRNKTDTKGHVTLMEDEQSVLLTTLANMGEWEQYRGFVEDGNCHIEEVPVPHPDQTVQEDKPDSEENLACLITRLKIRMNDHRHNRDNDGKWPVPLNNHELTTLLNALEKQGSGS